MTIGQFIDQAKPLGSCALEKCAAASLKKSFSPQLPILLAESVELSAFLAGEQAMLTGSGLASVDAGLAHPAGQAAGGKAQPLGHGVAGEALLKAELNSFLLLLRCEPASGLGGVDHQWTAWW